MPAGITRTDSMAYVGREPWHGLGTRVEGDAMTAVEAMEAADLDWEVKALPVFVDTFNHKADTFDPAYMSETMVEIESRKAITRVDTGEVFTVMTNRYTPVQNSEAFNFFDTIVGAGDAVYHTAGSLFGGKKVWILAKLEGEYTLDNGESLESFILLDNSHDGSSALRMRLTTVRVVCSNTLSLASGTRPAFATRHTSGIMNRVTQARNLLGLNQVHMDRFMEQCNRIAEQEFSGRDMTRLTYKLLDLNPDKSIEEQYPTRREAGYKLQNLFYAGVGNNGETRWDAFNAVTEFSDYHRGELQAETEDVTSRRLNRTWFSKGRNIREEAFRILTMPKVEMDSAISLL